MRVVLHPTCLGDVLAPEVARAAVALLERLGVSVALPRTFTCCGQPAFNAGSWEEARRVAAGFVEALSRRLDETRGEALVLPSGSCTAMVRHNYEALFADGPAPMRAAAAHLAAVCREMSRFLVGDVGVEDVAVRGRGKATYHPSCHGKRLLDDEDGLPRLLAHAFREGLVPLPHAEDCCGFGGVFAVVFPAVSVAMADEKLGHVDASGADLLITNDVGCLLHLRGRAARCRRPVAVRHWVEVLAEEEGKA